MTFKQSIAGFAAAAVLLTGVVFAQAPDTGRGQRSGKFGAAGKQGTHRFERMASELNLTEAQKQQAKTIFENARVSSKPLIDELRQVRHQLSEAAKANRPSSEIDALAAKQGDLRGQLSAIHSKAFADFYATLTPEQQATADKLREDMKNRMQHRRGGAEQQPRS